MFFKIHISYCFKYYHIFFKLAQKVTDVGHTLQYKINGGILGNKISMTILLNKKHDFGFSPSTCSQNTKSINKLGRCNFSSPFRKYTVP